MRAEVAGGVHGGWLTLRGTNSFTGLTQPQTQALAQKAHIYMTADGRISMAGLNGNNIDYFSESVSKAVKGDL